MTFTVQEMCFEVKDMEILVDVCPAEPDVGFFGNGKISIGVLDVRKLGSSKSIINELSSGEIDTLAADIYSQMEDREFYYEET